jgi:hypothetical protein
MAIQVRPTIQLEEKRSVLLQGMFTPSEFERFERSRRLTRRNGDFEFTAIPRCKFARELLLLGLASFEAGMVRCGQRGKKQ